MQRINVLFGPLKGFNDLITSNLCCASRTNEDDKPKPDEITLLHCATFHLENHLGVIHCARPVNHSRFDQ